MMRPSGSKLSSIVAGDAGGVRPFAGDAAHLGDTAVVAGEGF